MGSWHEKAQNDVKEHPHAKASDLFGGLGLGLRFRIVVLSTPLAPISKVRRIIAFVDV